MTVLPGVAHAQDDHQPPQTEVTVVRVDVPQDVVAKAAKDLEACIGKPTVQHFQREVSPDSSEPEPPKRGFQVSGFVRTGGGVLALCAGMVNAISFLALGAFVSHLTGTLSKVGLGLEDDSKADSGDSALLVVSFVLGSTWTGFLIGKDTIHFGLALYDICLLTEAALLVIATLTSDYRVSRYFAASACGLQNGLATHWGGAVIRTTHVTGLFTDVGLLAGRMLSMLCRKGCGKRFDAFDRVYMEDDLSKLSVLLTIAICFLVGIIAGAYLHEAWDQWALLVPAAITGGIGLAYSVYRVAILHHSLFSAEEMETVDMPQEILDLEKLQVQLHIAEEIQRNESAASVLATGTPQQQGESKSPRRSHRAGSTDGPIVVGGRLSPRHRTTSDTSSHVLTPSNSDAVARVASGMSDAFGVFHRSHPVVTMSRAEALEHMSHLGSNRLSGPLHTTRSQ